MRICEKIQGVGMWRVIIGAGLAIQLLLGGYATAQEKSFTLELNNAKDNASGCRLTYVAVNRTDTSLDKTAYEVVVFDKDGGVSQFLILEFGKLPVGKTKVVQFELKDNKCSNISRLLINDVSDCDAGGTNVSVCLDALVTKSRTDIEFGT